MRTMVRAAVAAIISPIYRSAFLSSRPPPEPLERRPSPLIARVLSTGLGEKQVPRVAALMVVSGMATSALFLSCGDSRESIRATQVADMPEWQRDHVPDQNRRTDAQRRATAEAHASRRLTEQEIAATSAVTQRREATAEAVWERRAQKTAQAETDRKHRIARALAATARAEASPTPGPKAIAVATEAAFVPWQGRRKSPPWADKLDHVPKYEPITCAHVRQLIRDGEITEDSVVKWMQWSAENAFDQMLDYRDWLPRSAPGECVSVLDYPHWAPPSPTPTPVGWHVYPWRRAQR